MDALGMADVPVGIGSAGGVSDDTTLECYDAGYSVPRRDIYQSGLDLVCRGLESVPDKSVQLLCLASLTDVAVLIKEHHDLFSSKVQEVVLMGGVMPLQENEMLIPDTAYNNNCDMASARAKI
jgi:inosine-uridine nucleoside N-ribohydrolase